MNNLTLNVPINRVSFGSVSIAILREIYQKSLFPPLLPIGGQVDLSAQKPLKLFESYIQGLVQNFYLKHNINNKVLKLWHLNGGLDAPITNNGNYLMTFHETDQITPIELNVINQQNKILVTSNYSKKVFEDFGARNVEYIQLGFDADNFWKLNKRPYTDDRIVFGLFGKLEHRKHHIKTIKAWASKYGNDQKYILHAAIFNPFLSPEDQTKIILHGLEGKKYWNINFLPQVQTNAEYNDIINSIDIFLGTSGGEAFNIPLFSAIALGKHAVVLDAHAHKDYADVNNSILISHKGKIPAQDNIFFHGQNSPFNQGNFYDFDINDMISACDLAIEKFKTNPININGLELQKRTYKDAVEKIFSVMS